MNEDRNAMALNSVAHFASPQTPEKNLCGFKTSKKQNCNKKIGNSGYDPGRPSAVRNTKKNVKRVNALIKRFAYERCWFFYNFQPIHQKQKLDFNIKTLLLYFYILLYYNIPKAQYAFKSLSVHGQLTMLIALRCALHRSIARLQQSCGIRTTGNVN